MKRRRLMSVIAALTVIGTSQSAAQVTRRFGVMVPMRDGVKLATDIWLPAATGQFPLILMRTPYLRAYPDFGFDQFALYFAQHGYAFAIQDVRGRGDSEGEFNFFFQEGPDGYDAIEWLATQPWANGRVGMMGLSYLGTTQWLAAREHPPHLVCMAPTAAAGRYLEELPSVGGAFGLQWAINWLNSTSLKGMQGNLAGVDWPAILAHRPLITMDSALHGREIRLFREFLQHQTLDDYWRRIIFTPDDFAKLDLPTLITTGWFDGDQPGALSYWRGMRAYSPAKDHQYLIAGPWTHPQTLMGGALSEAGFKFTPDSKIDNKAVHLEFFDYCLKGAKPAPEWPRARLYFTGSNVWRSFDEYPPRQATERPLYLTSGGRANTLSGNGKLSWDAPGATSTDRYTYDPRQALKLGFEEATLTKDGDHRGVERREDVLVYTSAPLTAPVTIAGTVMVELYAASDAKDTDFMVKLIDVQPDGRALKLGVDPVGVIRARYRQGIDREVFLTPGQVERYRIELYDIGHTFLPGHRIRLDVMSHHAPFFNPNQNTGNPIATDTVWRTAVQTIYHDHGHPSRILLPVLNLGSAAR
jgi:putative CocE/NonD family hydrolase